MLISLVLECESFVQAIAFNVKACFRLRLDLWYHSSFVKQMNGSIWRPFPNVPHQQQSIAATPLNTETPIERLYFVFEPENLIFTKHLISPIHVAMLPQFPCSSPGIGVFNYWDTGFVWSWAKIEIWVGNSDRNHTGSNQFNYPPIKVERPVIAVKGNNERLCVRPCSGGIVNKACLQGVLCSNS